jgi:hypothetical protein
MKTIGNIILTTFFIFLLLSGVVLVFNQAGVNNTLDEKSLQLISQYDREFASFKLAMENDYTTNKKLTEYDPDQNEVGTEAKEFFETKDKVNQLKSTVNLATRLPNLFFLSIPFVDQTAIRPYKIIVGLVLVISIFLAGMSAIFGKFWGAT